MEWNLFTNQQSPPFHLPNSLHFKIKMNWAHQSYHHQWWYLTHRWQCEIDRVGLGLGVTHVPHSPLESLLASPITTPGSTFTLAIINPTQTLSQLLTTLLNDWIVCSKSLRSCSFTNLSTSLTWILIPIAYSMIAHHDICSHLLWQSLIPFYLYLINSPLAPWWNDAYYVWPAKELINLVVIFMWNFSPKILFRINSSISCMSCYVHKIVLKLNI